MIRMHEVHARITLKVVKYGYVTWSELLLLRARNYLFSSIDMPQIPLIIMDADGRAGHQSQLGLFPSTTTNERIERADDY